jgi:hypothetical protein
MAAIKMRVKVVVTMKSPDGPGLAVFLYRWMGIKTSPGLAGALFWWCNYQR